jgi:predicted nucleic acid-binding protein
MKHQIYEADALQMFTSEGAECGLLFSADSNLVETAGKEGVEAVNIEADPERALASLEVA